MNRTNYVCYRCLAKDGGSQNETSGFYKLDGDLLCAPNFVFSAAFELLRDMHDQYNYPVDGWYWFDSAETAREFFHLPEPVIEQGVRTPTAAEEVSA